METVDRAAVYFDWVVGLLFSNRICHPHQQLLIWPPFSTTAWLVEQYCVLLFIF